MGADLKIKKILLLWSPLADYTVACLRELAKKQDVELYIIYQPLLSDAPYDHFDLSFFKAAQVYSRDKEKELDSFCTALNPDIILMSSWNYSFYMSVAKKCKRRGTYVVSAFDGQWRGTLRQRLGALVSPFFLKPAIHNFFVPGDRQATFAKKLGYETPFLGYYCANTERFQKDSVPSGNKFIYIGRLVSYKGIECLMNAYKKYRLSEAEPWGLVICGKGELKHICENQKGVELNNFSQPSDLANKISEAKCLILPSLFEPWGLVIHEAALAGLAIISSSACGASTFFVRDGQNGYIINPDEQSLVRAMKLISRAGRERLEQMSTTSKLLGSLWTTEKWSEYVYGSICSKNHRTA